ncbi:hypothetical protein FACS1894182_01010 [Bacteroidia bacterium]|nr:hypothetical protein FACS1894182_01010 [Bacteroidia bacterium]
MKVITFGRGENNEVVVNDNKVSRTHLQILQDDNGNFSLVDFNSTNGTFVNEQKVTGEVKLQPDDKVRIGNTDLLWQKYFEQQSSSPVPVSSVNSKSKKTSPVKNNRKTLTISAIVVLVAVICMIIVWLLIRNAGMKTATEVIIEDRKVLLDSAQNLSETVDQVQQNLIQLENEKKKTEEIYKKTLEQKEKEKELALKLSQAKSAEEIKKVQKEIQQQQTDNANEIARVAEEKKIQLERDKQEKAKLEEEKAKEEKAKNEAQKKAQLITDFYNLFPELKKEKQILANLGEQCPKGKKEKDYIKELFDQADNTKKENIIATIKTVLNKK